MKEIISWVLPVLLFGFFVLGAIANASIAMTQPREDGSKPSMIAFVPGICGAIALAIAPYEPLQAWWWLPVLLDVGTGGYLVIVLVAVLAGAFAAKQAEPVPERPLGKPIVGCILGTAVGDAIGLVYEGLSPRRQLKFAPRITGYRFFFNRGFCSDDTEHTCMLAQSLIRLPGALPDEQEKAFVGDFAWRLRGWLLGLPAGIGLATLRAILKLWIGFPGRWSGVFSAGNAPAMRCALIGVCHGHDPAMMKRLVRAATRITHTDPKAEYGALAVALAAHLAVSRGADITPAEFLAALRGHCSDAEFLALAQSVADSVTRGESDAGYAASIGCAKGVTGYMYHSVPCVLHVWFRHQDNYRDAIIAMIRLGGDTDTTAAILGAIIGARVGKDGIPAEWLADLAEWPRTVKWMEALGARLAERQTHHWALPALPVRKFKLVLRNVFFMIVVLLHGFRRLAPPY